MIRGCRECREYVMRCAIWYHLYNFKNMKNTHGGVYNTPVELIVQTPGIFLSREVSWNKGILINISCSAHEREPPQEKLSQFLLLDTPKIAF